MPEHHDLSFPSSGSRVRISSAAQGPGELSLRAPLPRSGFSGEEIFAELGAARGSRVEYFDPDAFSFRRLAKVDGLERALVKRLMNARWRAANPEAVRAYWRAWRAAHPERARSYVSRYAKSAKGRAVAKAKKLRWQRAHREAYNAAQRAAYARRVAARKAAP